MRLAIPGGFMNIASLFLTSLLLASPLYADNEFSWQLGPFSRADAANPIITPNKVSTFFCPVQQKEVSWECDHTFNPAAVVHQGKVYLLYRAEDDYGQGIGGHTSRIGLAVSSDGINFRRALKPVLYPTNDGEHDSEWPGGCEDPRIVKREDGLYVMTYTQWSFYNSNLVPRAERKTPKLAIATSRDLYTWEKHGYAFAQSSLPTSGSKSGSIICRQDGDTLYAVKLQGKYWMYWGDGPIFAATSIDLISWKPVLDSEGNLLCVLDKREGKFDSVLVEPGPPALLREEGILLLYNGKNDKINGDPTLGAGVYAAGQVLFDSTDPLKVVARTEECFFKPERDFEKTGQYVEGTVFIEGLTPFQGRWFLYYGTADSAVGVAVSE
jgi:predicted GH43/DUF377 family glycosyl hydrolase